MAGSTSEVDPLDIITLSEPALRNAAAVGTYVAVGTAVLRPRATGGLAQFRWSFERAFVHGAPPDVALVLLEALPTTPGGMGELQTGFHEGALTGLKDGFDSVLDTLAWLRDAGFSLLALAIDAEFGAELGGALALDFLSGADPLDGRTASLLDSRYPILLEVARGCKTLIEMRDDLKDFIVSFSEDSFFEVLGAANVTAARWLGQQLKVFVDELASLTGKPREQGRVVGRLYGRLGFEVVVEVLSLPIEPASLATKGAKVVTLAARGAKVTTLAVEGGRAAVASRAAVRLTRLSPEVATSVARRFSIRRALRAGMTLERALFEAYQDLTHMMGPHRKVRYRTGEFNRFYRTLADKEGWTSAGAQIRFDSHHVVEARVLKHEGFLNDPGFREAFDELGWSNTEDMLAVPLETEFHLGKGSTLADTFGLGHEPAVVGLDSLTVELMAKLGPLDQYRSFQELLDAYERIYRAPITFRLRNGAARTIDPLWTKVEPVFISIRRLLELPAPPAPEPKIPKHRNR